MPTILDLPVHAFAVHLPVVLVPLLVLLLVGYVLVPPLRRFLGWTVLALSVIAPITVFVARLSGRQYADYLDEKTGRPVGTWTNDISDHASYGDMLLWLTIALAPVVWLFATLERGRRSAVRRHQEFAPLPSASDDGADGDDDTPKRGKAEDDPAVRGRRIIMIATGVVALGLASASGYYVFQSGDSGAHMKWCDGTIVVCD